MKKKAIKIDKKDAAARVKKIIPILKKQYPDAKIALNFKDPLELLIATILSAQCTDARVNIVTKNLFKKYMSAHDWAKTDITRIENDIKSTGFYRNKAKNIKQACTKIDEEFDGKVPGSMEELVTLPGVGRKTAPGEGFLKHIQINGEMRLKKFNIFVTLLGCGRNSFKIF